MTCSGSSGAWATFTGKLYRPYSAITRHYMAVFFYRLAGSPDYTSAKVSPSTDVTTTQTFHKEICWLAERRISAGWNNGDGTHRSEPNWNVLRDQMAAFFYRANTTSIRVPTTRDGTVALEHTGATDVPLRKETAAGPGQTRA